MVIPNTTCEEDLELLKYFIKHLQVEDSVFAFSPSGESVVQPLVNENNYVFHTNTLLQQLDNPIGIKKVQFYLDYVGMDDEDKFNVVSDLIENERTLYNTGIEAIGIINVKKAMLQKKLILENDFFSISPKTDYHKGNYYFYLIYLLETIAMRDYIFKNDIDVFPCFEPVHFYNIAQMTMESFIKHLGNSNLNLVFEYFHITFKPKYQHLRSEFHAKRTRLLQLLAEQLGEKFLTSSSL